MPLTQGGRDFIAQSIVNDSAPTPFNNANAFIGAGDGTAAFAAAQTDLQASTNKLRRGMQATYPQRAANVLTFQSLFGTGDANWTWNEWGVFNNATAGVMLCRKVEALGVKASTQSWLLTTTIQINIGV